MLQIILKKVKQDVILSGQFTGQPLSKRAIDEFKILNRIVSKDEIKRFKSQFYLSSKKTKINERYEANLSYAR